MKFGLNDVFDSLEIAFDAKKIVFELCGLLIAILGYLLLSWLGTLTNNVIFYSLFQAAALAQNSDCKITGESDSGNVVK